MRRVAQVGSAIEADELPAGRRCAGRCQVSRKRRVGAPHDAQLREPDITGTRCRIEMASLCPTRPPAARPSKMRYTERPQGHQARNEMPLTEEARKQYLEKNGVDCPFCGSDEIEGGFVDIECGSAYQPVRCLRCEKRWNDVYALQDVEEVEG